MPYVGKDLSMIILLPKELNGLAIVEEKLTVANLKLWLDEIRCAEVTVSLPKFRTTSEFELAEALQQMGMINAFTDRADFSGMNGHNGWFISNVVHQAYVDVNEEGTEAAASTGIAMSLKAMPKPPPTFRADHPFIFLIRDNRTGSILFMGRVLDPTAS